MLAQAHTFTIQGPRARHVLVELDVRPGLPTFTIVGLADAAVREARERIQTAVRNCGFVFPPRRVTANLAPGDLPKAGAGLDLAIACALLAATGQLAPESLRHTALYGELALDGRIRAAHGALAVAHASHACGIGRLAVARASASEAALIEDLDVAPIADLASAVRVLEGGPPDAMEQAVAARDADRDHDCPGPDLLDVRGQRHAVLALLIAAAGGHSILFSGSPGTGKTMLARRLPSILPPLSRTEAIETMLNESSCEMARSTLPRRRPFRAPHHSITSAGLIGGAVNGSVGEIVRAHRGVLFLDELSEFSRSTLEALRQPLEDGHVTISRANHAALYPTRFMLVAATNPCPCGYADEPDRCRCSRSELTRHVRRLSGPLMERIDLHVTLRRQGSETVDAATGMSSARAAEKVQAARARQTTRLEPEGMSLNSEMDAQVIRRQANQCADSARMLGDARTRGLLSARGEHRVLRVARTIADLAAREEVGAADIGMALALRCNGAF